jgi:ABC-2 type transport system permease protein
MIRLLFLNYIRAKSYSIALVILLISSLLSLYIGDNFIIKYQRNIEQTAHYQQETIERYVKFENKEMGLLLYYLKFGLVNELPNLAGLSIGQRDINPSIMNVTIRNLEEQKYNTELHNPMYQLLGNFDFSFVLIYFFPLVIISFCFNLLSDEKENGTWKLLSVQAVYPFKIIFYKIAIRFVVVQALLAVVLASAKFFMAIPFNAAFIAFSLMAIMYVTFWFSLNWFIISLQRESNYNALALLILWIVLTIVAPATTNAIITHSYPNKEAFQTVIENRDGYHKKWDIDKQATIGKFMKHYPQFSKFTHPDGNDFSWLWYYAMQQMGDDEVQQYTQGLKAKLASREQMGRTIGYFFPTIHTQLTLNQLAYSDLGNQLRFWEAVAHFHEQKRLHFYPKIFADAPVLKENWGQWALEYFKQKENLNWVENLLPMLLITLIFITFSIKNFNHVSSSKFI